MRSLNYDELFIGGRWQAPSTGQRLSVISPHTEESIGETPEASAEDVDKAVRAARTAFDEGPWPRLSVDERMEKIEKLAAVYAAESGCDRRPHHRRDGLAQEFLAARAGRGRRRADAPEHG